MHVCNTHTERLVPTIEQFRDADIKCKLYADDVNLYSEIVTDDDRTRLQENFDASLDGLLTGN